MGTTYYAGCKVTVDEDHNLVYIHLHPERSKKGVVAVSADANVHVVADYDHYGKLYGIELLSLPRHPLRVVKGGKEP